MNTFAGKNNFNYKVNCKTQFPISLFLRQNVLPLGKIQEFYKASLTQNKNESVPITSWKENRKVWANLAGQLLLCCGFCCHKLSRFHHVQLFVTFWIVACQAAVSMGFTKQEYWSGLPCPAPGDLPGPGIEPVSLISPALAGRFFTTSTTWEAAATAAKSLQSCPTLCNPIDGSPPGSPVPGILQARTPEWVAISSSNTWEAC